MSSPQTTSEVAAVADAIRSHDRFFLVTHEKPHGDALRSLLPMKLALDQLGKDAVMYLYGDAPLPAEYRFMELGDLHRKLPDDWRERVLLALDCANEHRLGPDPELLAGAPLLHDVGYHISYDRHHKHSYYLISHAELLGMSPVEQLVVANVARYHRGARPKKNPRAFGSLDKPV